MQQPMTETSTTDAPASGPADQAAATPLSGRRLTPAAERALAEAAERRQRHDKYAAAQPAELGGRTGPDPVRYGDWENGGIASDF